MTPTCAPRGARTTPSSALFSWPTLTQQSLSAASRDTPTAAPSPKPTPSLPHRLPGDPLRKTSPIAYPSPPSLVKRTPALHNTTSPPPLRPMSPLHDDQTVFDLAIATVLRRCGRFILLAHGEPTDHWIHTLSDHQLFVLYHEEPASADHLAETARLLFVAERPATPADPHGHTILLGVTEPLVHATLRDLYDMLSIQTLVDLLTFDPHSRPCAHYLAIAPATLRTEGHLRALDRHRPHEHTHTD